MPAFEHRDAGDHSNEPRVLMRDVIPYEVVGSLDALRGPGEGVLRLPHHVYWGPQADCDLGRPEGVFKAYQAVLREGTRADQELLLNAGLLVKVWEALMLPVRVRDLWENKFPQLARHS